MKERGKLRSRVSSIYARHGRKRFGFDRPAPVFRGLVLKLLDLLKIYEDLELVGRRLRKRTIPQKGNCAKWQSREMTIARKNNCVKETFATNSNCLVARLFRFAIVLLRNCLEWENTFPRFAIETEPIFCATDSLRSTLTCAFPGEGDKSDGGIVIPDTVAVCVPYNFDFFWRCSFSASCSSWCVFLRRTNSSCPSPRLLSIAWNTFVLSGSGSSRRTVKIVTNLNG